MCFWGHIPAADYRKVIVGLIFLRYVSAAFENKYKELKADISFIIIKRFTIEYQKGRV